MTPTRETAGLTKGLRALDALAAHAPLDVAEFASAVRMSLAEAAELLETFECHGYARQVPGGSLFVLTRFALRLVAGASLAGRLVSEAIEPIVATGDRIGQIVAISIPRGSTLVCCAVSRQPPGSDVRPGMHRTWSTAPLTGTELAVPVIHDGEAIAVLSVHFADPTGAAHQAAMRAELERLASQLLNSLAGHVARPASPTKRPSAAACQSALLH